MNHTRLSPLPPGGADALEARLARRMAARLAERADQAAPDIAERLRFAREQALARAREVRRAEQAPAVQVAAGGVASLVGGSGPWAGGWWLRFGSALPVLVLAAGLMLIGYLHDQAQISAAAEIDAELLADDLPPGAYTDAGFAEFLKSPAEQE